MFSTGGLLKLTPVAAILGALSVRDLALYVGVVTTLSGVLIVGALVSAAKAWRERAEARTDQALELIEEMKERDTKIADLDRKVIELKAELKARPDLREVTDELRAAHAELRKQDADEHRAIIAAVDRLSGALTGALERNTVALESLAKHVPWADIIDPARRRRAS